MSISFDVLQEVICIELGTFAIHGVTFATTSVSSRRTEPENVSSMIMKTMDPTHDRVALLVLGIIEYLVEDRSTDDQAMYKDIARLLWISHRLKVNYSTMGRSLQ